MKGFQFKDAPSYEVEEQELSEPEIEYDEKEEATFKDDFKEFLLDKSPKGLFKKGFILFLIILYVLLFSAQNIVSVLNANQNIEMSFIPHKVIFNVLHNPMMFILLIMVSAVISSSIISLLVKKNIVSGYELSEKTTHGSAKLETDESMKGGVGFRPIDDPEGIVLGRKTLDATGEEASICTTRDLGRNMNAAIFGSSGAGKSYSFARPNILTRIARGDSYIITDPAGELYRDTAAIAEENGYTVRVLNLKNLGASNGWNPFDVFKGKDMMDVQVKVSELVHSILTNTKDENAKADVFFSQSEENLLKALILYVAISPNFAGEEFERHLGTVYDLLAKLAAQDGFLDEFATLPDDDPASVPWKMFQGAGKLKSNFITGLAASLEIFQIDPVKEAFSHSEIDLSAPGKEKCAYYIISSVSNDKMRFLLSLFFSCAFEELMLNAEQNKTGKLDIPVYFILDEFKAIGRINSFGDKVANVRKYGISIAIIFQDMKQLEQAYPNSYTSILSNCDTWLVLGVNDDETAKMLSNRTGIATVIQRSESHPSMKQPLSRIGRTANESVSETKRNLMNPDEITRYFDFDTSGRRALIFARAKGAYPVSSMDWHLHKLGKYVDMPEYKREATEFIPPWQKGEWNINKKRSFLTLDTPMAPQAPVRNSFSAAPKPSENPKEDLPKVQDVLNKRKGTVFNTEARSQNLVSLDFDLGKK